MSMIKAGLAGSVAGGLFFFVWSVWKILYFGTLVNIVYALPVITVFALGAVGVICFRRHP